MSDQRVAALQQYLTSLAPDNPAWHANKHHQENHQQGSFTGRLHQEYSCSKREEIQRSLNSSSDGHREDFDVLVTLQMNTESGRHLVTSRDILAGEEIFRETLLVVAPRPTPDPTCLACLRPLEQDWHGCGDCGAPLCYPHCTGTLHEKEECHTLARLDLNMKTEAGRKPSNIQLLNESLTPLRTLLHMESVPQLQGVVAALQSNVGQRQRLGIGQAAAARVAAILNYDKDVVSHILGVFDTNAFTVSRVGNTGGTGRALVPVAALMNHNCTPNTQHWFQSGAIIVKAVCDIPKGREVTNSYAPALWGTAARAKHLATSKLFRCRCQRCQDPIELGSHLSSLACRGSQCGGLLVPPDDYKAPWTCNLCGTVVDGGAAEVLVRGAAGAVRSIGREGDVDSLKLAVSHLSRTLGRTHYVTREASYALLLAILSSPLADVSKVDLQQSVKISRDLLEVADMVDPGFSRFRGVLLLELARASTELLRRRVAAVIHDISAPETTTQVTKSTDKLSNNRESTDVSDDTRPIIIITHLNNTTDTVTAINYAKNSTTETSLSNSSIGKLQINDVEIAEKNANNLLLHRYNLHTIQNILATADESETILKFDSRLLDVMILKEQLQELNHQLTRVA